MNRMDSNKEYLEKHPEFTDQLSYDLIDDYADLSAYHLGNEIWKKCTVCHSLPKVWKYNNGSSAACKCFYKYDPKVKGESIMSILKRTGQGNGSECWEKLRTSWNHAE